MDNPLELAAPTEPLAMIHAYARDLAWGALRRYWTVSTVANHGSALNFVPYRYDEQQLDLLNAKWPGEGSPTCEMMQTFGYFLHDTDGSYLITQKAFALLEHPVTLPTVFISYSRKSSSAFGLLIECRLQMSGIKAFIDRSIDPGDAWHAQLEDKIRHSTCLVSLIAPETLNSHYVQKEIQWALDQNIMLIPIWHGAFDGSNIPATLELLGSKNAIRVKEESAEAYHEAVEKLINRLGFVTP